MAKRWNEVKCSSCKKYIAADALKCPFCQTEFTAAKVEARKRQNDQQNRDALKGGLTLAVLVGVVLWGMSSCGDDKAETKAEVVAKAAQWNKIAILENLKSCRAGEGVIRSFVDRRDRHGAYRAAIGSKNECSRAMVEAPDEPYECTEVAMYGAAYYNDFAESIDTMNTAPSTLEALAGGKRIFAEASQKCEATLAKAGGAPQSK